MKLLTHSLVLLSFVPALAGASSGTIHFRGALVEPTCQAEVLDTVPGPGHVALRLFDCNAKPATQARAMTAGGERQLRGAMQTLTLSAPMAELAGRAQLEMLTLSYE